MDISTSGVKPNEIVTTIIEKVAPSKITATIDTKEFFVTLLDRASITLDGTSSYSEIESVGNTIVKGKEFECDNVLVKIGNSANASLNAIETIEIYATNSSKLYLYSNPKITITEFYDKASIFKRDLGK